MAPSMRRSMGKHVSGERAQRACNLPAHRQHFVCAVGPQAPRHCAICVHTHTPSPLSTHWAPPPPPPSFAVLQQALSMPVYIPAIMLLWTYASLVPITKGVQNNEAFGGWCAAGAQRCLQCLRWAGLPFTGCFCATHAHAPPHFTNGLPFTGCFYCNPCSCSLLPPTTCLNLLCTAGPFSPQAEKVNGRAAMLGLALLLFIESKAGVPFF